MMCARSRAERNEAYKKHPQYENDLTLVISETKKVVEGLKDDKSEDKSFSLVYRSLPAYVCAVLIHDYLERLDAEERAFCKDILIEHASAPLREGYRYQIGDGVDVAISTLPSLLKVFPNDAGEIRTILLLTLFDSYPVGMGGQLMLDHPTGAILNTLWKESVADANCIFLGFLMLKPTFDKLGEATRREGRKRSVYEFSNHDLLKTFVKAHDAEMSKIVAKKIAYSDLVNIDQMDPDMLITAFRLLLIDTADETHQTFFHQIFPIFSKKLFKDSRDATEKTASTTVPSRGFWRSSLMWFCLPKSRT